MGEKILLHACCGPCAIYPTQFLAGQGSDFALYYFNPNIHPYQEFKRRLAALRDFAAAERLELIVDKSYPLEDFLRNALAQELRCDYCYKVRMFKAAEFARDNGFAAFSTTLLGSPYQRHEAIVAAAEQAGKEYGVRFAYFDFRPGFATGREVSIERQMYRQAYCGCVFSERDRYEKKKKAVD